MTGTDPIRSYLQQVLRYSGLSGREKREWSEEMAAHLREEIALLKDGGQEPDEALRTALEQFGEPAALRRRIARETFGLSLQAIVILTSVFFALFVVDCILLVSAVNAGQQSVYIPNVLDMLRALPLSPSLMLALCLCTLSLLVTRRRRDRIALCSQSVDCRV